VLDFVVAIAAASLAAGLLAVVTERVAYRPVRKAGRIAALLTAVGVSLLLQNLAVRVWGAETRSFPDPKVFVDLAAVEGPTAENLWAERTFTTTRGERVIETAIVVPKETVVDDAVRGRVRDEGWENVHERATLSPRTIQAFVLVALAFWAPVLWWLVKRTRMGKAMRAVSEDTDAARLMGIPIDRVISATFFLGAFVAGVGGVAYIAAYGTVHPLVGFLPGLKAFVAAVIGGIGSIPGAILGGLILGVTESVLPFLLQRAGWSDALAWKDAIAFAFLIVVLVVKPTGLLGKPRREKV
jgi:branched-chain amino acid transport system permease protein